MTKYLIMKCEELGDQFECDANREPMFLVDDWKKWYWENQPNYMFEVYKFEDEEECTLEKRYEEAMEEGMALYFWRAGENPEEVPPTVIAHYKDYDRHSAVPKKVRSVFRQGAYWSDDDEEYTEENFKNDLKCCGSASWEDKKHEKYWVYGHYADGRYSLGY